MKDLLERIFKYLPHYVSEFASMVGQPKRTIIARNSGDPEDLNRAMLFVGVTVAIGFVLQSPLLGPEDDFVALAGGLAAFKIVAILSLSAMVWGAWRIVGGTGGYVPTLVAYLYTISPFYLASIVLELIGIGIVRRYDPETAQVLQSHLASSDAKGAALYGFLQAQPGPAVGYLLVMGLLVVGFLVWPVICWGAYRDLHGVSRSRSAAAYCLSFLALTASAFLVQFLILGLFGTEITPIK